MRVDTSLGVETQRLILRRLTPQDAPALFRTAGDPEVMCYWAPGPDPTVEATARRIQDIERHWEDHCFGDWGVVEKTTNELIGFSGLHFIAKMDEVNIGYALQKSVWRRGYGTEICQAVLAYGFETLRLDTIVAVIAPQNDASIALARKAGLSFRKPLSWLRRDRVVYSMSRADYVRSSP